MANGQDLTDLVPHLRTVHFALLLACILTLLPTIVGRRGEVSEAHRQLQKIQAMQNSWDRWTQKFSLDQINWLRTLGVHWLAPASEHAYIDSPTLTQAGIRHSPGSVLGVRLVGAPLYFHLHVKGRPSGLVLAVPYGKLNVSDVFPLEISFPGEDSGSQRFASLADFREFWAGARLTMVTFLQRFLPVTYLVVDGAIRSELRASPTIELGRSGRPERAKRSMPAIAAPKAAVLKRLRAMHAKGLSLQAMANRLTSEGVPTLSGKGRWQKGTIGNLLAESEQGHPGLEEASAMKIVISLLIFLAGCVATPRYTNTRAGVGARPEQYEQTIRDHLRVALMDPYRLQDLGISEPELTACTIASGYPFYGWRVSTQYNAKNAYGAYVGLRRSFYWFHGERLRLITADALACPEGW